MSPAPKPCAKNCKGQIVNKSKGIYCKCIEKKLPKPSRQSVQASNFGFFAIKYESESDYWERHKDRRREVTENEIAVRLKAFGLDAYEVDLVMLRVIEQKPMKEVVAVQGWTDLNSANYYLRKVLRKLRDGGFELR